jgi:DNA-binding ferritin-like protein
MRKMLLSEKKFEQVKDTRLVLEDLCADWSNMEFCELSSLLSVTRALAQLHQTHHWQASGNTFYGDHLLFERIYSDTSDEIDKIAERLVGLSTNDMVDTKTVASQTLRVLEQMFVEAEDSATCSLNAEKVYVKFLSDVSNSLESQGLLTYGVDNLLADMADKHEEHIYLLTQRSS